MRDDYPDTEPQQFKQDKPECFAHNLSVEAKKAAQSLGLQLHHVDGFYFALGFDHARSDASNLNIPATNTATT